MKLGAIDQLLVVSIIKKDEVVMRSQLKIISFTFDAEKRKSASNLHSYVQKIICFKIRRLHNKQSIFELVFFIFSKRRSTDRITAVEVFFGKYQ